MQNLWHNVKDTVTNPDKRGTLLRKVGISATILSLAAAGIAIAADNLDQSDRAPVSGADRPAVYVDYGPIPCDDPRVLALQKQYNYQPATCGVE